ncbi:helix-turn-helix domain-containing protein [Companilactobacillus sp.]|uniref:helix-turn-helix domain-containing protein n=1 Tax=Companilactobacillus sp. TaxID=2767905 RepID=UPI0025BD8D79|nr:helix-turn-helix transcriptional regulator [Companilactobacillus sp.]MCH4008470.1 helix-turn-helix domain-containing protein [Companilactobacillus sp.]MCH4051351.1 helix-turn-helix domain-containing protein [Companilactobacillus sp.]MCH4076413.1 helix-turn-helix domain-containing protein [Companilactobacillus sp.]MCH4124988.1 helix-turn-helix domain-containing protein [Companilactobacillus sp.]MCH4131530.1 helix-turn-helix domain-containing protein [Companilactobacillus sp.]
MKILGEKIRHYRKLRGISQSELADGICTQATVSLIEKKDKIPSMEILVRICERLGITMNLVIVNDDSQIYSIISEIKKLFYQDDYDGIVAKLDKLKDININNKQEIKLIHFFSGLVEYEVEKNYDKAIFDFNRAMNVNIVSVDMYDILINIYTAKAYVNKGSDDEAKVYYDQSKELIKSSVEKINDENYRDSILIYANMAELALELGDNESVIEYANEGIYIARKEQSLFKLDSMYCYMAEAGTKDGQKSDEDYIKAYVISSISDNKNVFDTLKSKISKMSLNIFNN